MASGFLENWFLGNFICLPEGYGQLTDKTRLQRRVQYGGRVWGPVIQATGRATRVS